MLPERCRQLLTSYVDGELTARQRRHVERLLHRSEEARGLLRRLQADAEVLRNLPRPRLDSDLSSSVLKAIAERRLSPGRRRAAKALPHFPSWAGLAAAAALLLAVGMTSYLYFSATLDQGQSPATAQKRPEAGTTRPDVNPEGGPSVAKVDRTPAASGPDERPTPKDPPKSPSAVKVVKHPRKGPVAPKEVKIEPAPDEPVFTDRTTEPFKVERVDVALPTLFRLVDLGQPGAREGLADELRKDRAFRLELPCADGARAFARLQGALKARGVAPVIEPVAQARLKKPQGKVNFALYVESLTPEELSRVLQQVGAEEGKGAARKPADVRFFGHVVITPLGERGHKELTELMGLDPTRVPPRKPSGPLGIDPRTPLPQVTAAQVAQALAGQGPPRPQPGKPVAKPAAHTALVMAYTPARPSAGSPELKRFLDGRKQARPGAVAVLLVLRCTGF